MLARAVLLTVCSIVALDSKSAASEGEATLARTAAERRIEARMREVLRADYCGETRRLNELAAALAADTSGAAGAYAQYWRGFALWRRAANTMNTDPRSAEALADLRMASAAFARADAERTLLADALSARAACIMTLGAMSGSRDSFMTSIEIYPPLLTAAEAAEPGNPRVAWVRSMSLFYTPGAGPAVAVTRMEEGLAMARRAKGAKRAALAPAWGEPENLMNLAWAWSNRPGPDLERAERYAMEALALVPDWHYVRNILLPSIQKARTAAAAK